MINWTGHHRKDGSRDATGTAMSGRWYEIGGPDYRGDDRIGDALREWSALAYEATDPAESPHEPYSRIAYNVTRDEAFEACERHESALCVPEARAFVAAAEAHRRVPGEGERAAIQALRLLETAEKIDVDVDGVEDAIRAAAFLQGAGRVASAADYLLEFRVETKAQIEAHQAAESVGEPEIRLRGPRM